MYIRDPCLLPSTRACTCVLGSIAESIAWCREPVAQDCGCRTVLQQCGVQWTVAGPYSVGVQWTVAGPCLQQCVMQWCCYRTVPAAACDAVVLLQDRACHSVGCSGAVTEKIMPQNVVYDTKKLGL